MIVLNNTLIGLQIEAVRLVTSSGSTSSSNTAGRLEVYYNGQWGTVCNDGFGSYNARTACLQLGFSSYINYGSVSSLGYIIAVKCT